MIKAIQPQAFAKVDDLKTVVSKVNSLEDAGSITPWAEEQIPEEIVSVMPDPG